MEPPDPVDLPRRLCLCSERRKKGADRESDREPDQPHAHLDGGWLPGSLAERHDAHQHRAARARHPDAVACDAAVEIAASEVLS